jgi:hypothetical protein
LTLADGPQPIASAGGTLNVEPPVAIERIEPAVHRDGRMGLQITLKEITGSDSAGTLNVRLKGIPETQKTIAYTLTPNQSQAIDLWIDALDVWPIQCIPAEVTLTTSKGYTLAKSCDVNFFAIGAPTAPIVVDGDLAEWSDSTVVTLQGLDCVTRSPEFYTGDKDLHAQFRFACDQRALYVAVDVTDDIHCQPHIGYNTWKGDCVQLAIDLDARRDEIRTGNDLADKGSRHRVSEISLALTAKGAEAYRTMSFDEQKLPIATIAGKDIALAVTRTGTRTIYEAAIPWQTLGGQTCPADPMIGFAISINDADTADQVDPSAVGAFVLKDTRKFGRLLLKGATK